MKIRTRHIAPLALTAALAFGTAACDASGTAGGTVDDGTGQVGTDDGLGTTDDGLGGTGAGGDAGAEDTTDTEGN